MLLLCLVEGTYIFYSFLFICVCSQHAAPEVQPAVKACRDLATLDLTLTPPVLARPPFLALPAWLAVNRSSGFLTNTTPAFRHHPPPGGAGGWRERPNSRHSITNKAVRRRPRSTLKIYRLNNKVEWKVKYASLSYFTG